MTLVYHLYKQYIRNSAKKAIVQSRTVLLCHLTAAVMKGVGLPCTRVYINTRVIKHVYDKRPAEEFDFCIENISQAVKYPDKIYKNKIGKRGAFCFLKKMRNSTCFVSIETINDEQDTPIHCEVATFFRPDDDYLKRYELLWEWKDGTPSS